MLAMKVFGVWLDYQGNWHSWEEVGAELVGSMSWSEDSARRTAKILTGKVKGTSSIIGKAVVVYCIHAPTRSRAMTLARQRHRGHTSKRTISFSVRRKGSKNSKRVSFIARR